MSISNDLDEVSTFIVCPGCKTRSPKDWIVKHMESKTRPRVRNLRFILDASFVTRPQRYSIRN